MTRILVITRGFPYTEGESFVAPEAAYWQRPDAEVVVLPWRTTGTARPLPDGIRVDPCLAQIPAAARRRARLRSLASPLLWREAAWLLRNRRANRTTLTEAVRAVGGALAMRDALAGWIERNGPVDVAYCYWWDVWAFGAQLLQGKGIGHVVTRAHGYDLYESRQPGGHLALKRQLGPGLHRLWPVSQDGVRYAVDTYRLDPQRVQAQRLGVDLPDTTSPTSPAGELRLASTASMAPVKRLDRLVDALGVLCREHPELRLTWTHFGDGPLRDELQQRLDGLGSLENLVVDWRGNVANDELRAHFTGQPVDLFLNTSESEGVPVSIMEAMAFGVPVLAPGVGGIGEIVPAAGLGGELLGAAPQPDEIAQRIWDWREQCKQDEQRAAARAVVADRYDQRRNYTAVMDELVALGR